MKNMFSKCWNDPVWSKVIAGIILGVLGTIYLAGRPLVNSMSNNLILIAILISILAIVTLLLCRKNLHNVTLKAGVIEKRHNKRRAQAELRLFNEMSQSTVFFSNRFSKAFPGCRDICEFNAQEALQRLDILLRHPIVAENEYKVTPIWWFRGGSALHISSYSRKKRFFLKTDEFVLSGIEEYKLKKLIAVGDSSYFRQFVYIEAEGMTPSGLYELDEQIKREGYAREEFGEYGVFKKPVRREHLDDGATIIKGRVHNIAGKAKLKTRMIGKYNFLIAAHAAPLNSKQAENHIEHILNGMLQGTATIQDLVKLTSKLPKHQRDA